jgi:amino acid adenylation domain-containing protein
VVLIGLMGRNLVHGLCYLFEKQVEKTPDKVAVVFKDQSMTYRELNTRANQLAHFLRREGVGVESLVALSTERSLEFMVGLLGILKAGGAYVPLDPSYPQDRLNFILQDTQAPFLLTQSHLRVTQSHLREQFKDYQGRVFRLDTDWHQVEKEAQENPPILNTLNNLAYIIYTSGSTGKPKGVLVEHQNLLNSINARLSYYSDPVKGFLLLSSIAFDSSIAGIFWPLVQGGTLILPSQEAQYDPSEIIKVINQQAVSHILCVPSLYGVILAQAQERDLDSLKVAIVAGESCSNKIVEEHSRLLSSAHLFNEYGPTEATVWSSVKQVYDADSKQVHEVTIGRPIANAKLYILDRQLQPVPIGTTGEIYIGGGGIARGYLNQPELTAERFIHNPFETDTESRLYKTGDLACYLPDGDIKFLGRADHQVKIRGYRIELEEIETVLASHKEVKEAAVVAQGEEEEQKQLVAYVVTKDQLDPEEDAADLVDKVQRYLKERLPLYMVPNAIVVLENFPLTPNGKVDRKALPEPNSVSNTQLTYVPPYTLMQCQLVKIWEDLLNREPIGIYDNFFNLGGSSLLIVGLVAKIKDVLGKSISITNVFNHPTIFEISELIDKDNKELSKDFIFTIQKNGHKNPLFLIHTDDGLAFEYNALSYYLPDQPMYGINNPRLGESHNAFNSIEEMANCYVEQIIKIDPQGPYKLGGLCFSGIVAFEMAQQLQKMGRKVEILLLIDSFNHPWHMRDTEYKQFKDVLNFRRTDSLKEHQGIISSEIINNIKLMLNYYPEKYSGYTVLLKANKLDEVSMDSCLSLDPYNGWYGIVEPNLEIYSLPAEHTKLFSTTNVEHLSEKISYCLSKTGLDPLLSIQSPNTFDHQLVIAAKNNDLFLVNKFLERNANVNTKDLIHRTPLHWAAYNGNLNMVRILIENGANTEMKDRDGMTLVELANSRNVNVPEYIKQLKSYSHQIINKKTNLKLHIETQLSKNTNSTKDLLAQNHKKTVNDTTLHGLSNDGKNLYFKINSDYNNLWEYFSECLGLEKETEIKKLIEHSESKVVRELSAPQIYQFLLRDNLPKDINTIELDSLKSKYARANEDFSKIISDTKENLLKFDPQNNYELALLSLEGFLNWLSTHPEYVTHYKNISQARLKLLFPLEWEIMGYAQKESVFITYIEDHFLQEEPSLFYQDNIQENNPIPSVLDAIAYINNIYVTIWKKSTHNNTRLTLVHRYGLETWKLAAHLLHLDEVDTYQELDIIEAFSDNETKLFSENIEYNQISNNY